MQGSPGKTILAVVLVILAVGAVVWSAMTFMKGPQSHSKMTPHQIWEMEQRRVVGRQAPR